MMQPRWTFRKYMPGDRARNSQVEKFFKSDAVDSHPVALVREGIQNTLDACPKGPAHVRITIGQVAAEDVRPFSAGLFPHLNAIRERLPTVPTPETAVRFLTFEDFHTTGLTGDPRQWAPHEDSQNPFYDFFYGEGVTDKRDTARGRHGVGKMVFSVASRARCILCLTCTERRGRMLMGTATLLLHYVDRQPYHPDGWFGLAEPIDDLGQHTVPVTDSAFLNSFESVFGLTRGNSPGLSIVVPWVDDSFTHEALVEAVIEGYFWPILRGELTVEIETPEKTCCVNRSTLPSTLEQLRTDTQSRLRPLISLAQTALSGEIAPVTCSGICEAGKPKFTNESLTDSDRKNLSDRLESGEPVHVRIPLTIRRKSKRGHDPFPTYFDIYLRRDAPEDASQILFIREGLIISQTHPRRCPGYRGLVIAEDEHIATFLGDAENPSHTEWQKDNVKDRYVYAKGTLDFVVQSVPNLLRLLESQKEEANTSLFIDLFSVPSLEKDKQKKKSRKPKPKGPGESTAPEIDVPRKPRQLSLEHRPNGFIITRGNPKASRPDQILIQVAYETSKGNPFKKYNAYDFELGRAPIEVETSGCSIEEMKGNRLRVTVTADDFQVAVTGFDPNRDIRVDARPKKAEADDATTV